MHRYLVAGLVVLCGGMALSAQADEWSQFRGPNNGGVVSQSVIPTEWSAEKNVAWKVAIPGVAWSSPVVWGDKVFITTAVSEKQEKPKAGMGGGFGGPGGRGGFPPRDGAGPQRRPGGDDEDQPNADRPNADRPNGPGQGRGPGGFQGRPPGG